MKRLLLTVCLAGCLSEAPQGLSRIDPAATTVGFDLLHRPLPEIPLPNDVATRYDPTSATGRRINASMVAPTSMERRVREQLDQLDGWGVLQPITIPFTGPLDVGSIVDLKGGRTLHSDPNYDFADDVVYLVDITPSSPDYGKPVALDVGNGNYPVLLEKLEYWKNDPRGDTLSIFFEEHDEDTNGNGKLDRDEDTDADGVLDKPNYLPGRRPAADDLAGRADALMTFYERETNTLILNPIVPLRERTTYAVVVTRRLRDAAGEPVGSPFPFVNHESQTEALKRLPDVLPAGLKMSDVAFAFAYTTQSFSSHWVAVREGLYGEGVQAHLGRDFPADVAGVARVLDRDVPNPHIVPAEVWKRPFGIINSQIRGIDANSDAIRNVNEAQDYVDYLAAWTFESPQLFERTDADGNPLPLDAQSWPPDLDRVAAKARRETVHVLMAVPRKEVSARGEGKPAPVVLLGHGYTGNRFDAATFGGWFARQGLATLSIDCVSHGLELDPDEEMLARTLLKGFGLEQFGNAVLTGRAFDQDADGRADSGADFWTAYLFHTRDVVRQCALDHMQLVRILRSFDGQRRWSFDLNGDGQPELAGDFDADGQVDFGGDGFIGMSGGSLGGIMSTVVGALEPNVQAIAPIAGGGGLGHIGLRSQQGGVREAVILRVMGPLYVATVDAATGTTAVETIVPSLNNTATRLLGHVEGVRPGDTMIVENLVNGRRGCGYVDAEGRARAAVDSDRGDRTALRFYRGRQLVPGSTECELVAGATSVVTVDTFLEPVEFEGATIEKGTPLAALAEGLGERRASPGMRRFLALGQLVLDGGDPATYARHLLLEPLEYPRLGEKTGAHTLVVTTVGDMNVPASSGLTVGRAAGLIDYTKDDPRYGVPPNQVLLDNYVAEAVHTYGRFRDAAGEPVHIDVENFSGGDDPWGDTVPRLDPPLRLNFAATDRLGGRSAAIFPYAVPTGQHGFAAPGEMTDALREACRAACAEGDDCGCDTARGYDVGAFMFNMIGRFLATGGAELRDDACQSADACAWIPPPPPDR